MQTISKVLLAIALLFGAFAFWGLETSAGARFFDEMDGLIPFFAGVFSVVLATCAAILWCLARRRAR